MRITEVDFHIRGHREGFVSGHLQPAIPRQRAPQGCWKPANLPAQGSDHRRRIFAAHLDQGSKTRMAFHQRRYVAVFCAADEIAFPMTGNGAVLNFSGPFPDGDGIYDLTARVFKDTRVLRVRDTRINLNTAGPALCRASPENCKPSRYDFFFFSLVSIPGAICAKASSPCLACCPYCPLGSRSTAF